MTSVIEFYDNSGDITRVKSTMVPPVGAKINIRGKTWVVDRVTYAVDYSYDPHAVQMRANVDLVEV